MKCSVLSNPEPTRSLISIQDELKLVNQLLIQSPSQQRLGFITPNHDARYAYVMNGVNDERQHVRFGQFTEDALDNLDSGLVGILWAEFFGPFDELPGVNGISKNLGSITRATQWPGGCAVVFPGLRFFV